MVESPKKRGELTEAIVLAQLIELGYRVSIPFGENTRYDFVVDKLDGKLHRVQVKTGRLTQNNSVITFRACSQQNNRTTSLRKGYREQIDAFVVYCPELDFFYWIPISDIKSNTDVNLRISPSINNQSNGVTLAADYIM